MRFPLAFVVSACAAQVQDHVMFRSAFSPDECEQIQSLFLRLPAELDNRAVALLPNMDDSFRVSRINHFDDGSLMARGSLDFIYERLLSLAATREESDVLALGSLQNATPSELKSLVGFNLMHAFEQDPGQPIPQFDWHADTKPGDGKQRTLNVNVMLSVPGVDFDGGELEVGAASIGAQQGDMYVYPAGVAHRVRPLLRGRRYTLVIAMEAGTFLERTSYWDRIEASFKRLATSSEPKLHILHGGDASGI